MNTRGQQESIDAGQFIRAEAALIAHRLPVGAAVRFDAYWR